MSLPALQHPDAALLTRYLLAHEDLHALLSQPNAPELLPLLEFLARPDITPWLDHYRSLQSHARQHAALDALADVLRSSPDLIQRRLAATALLHRAPRPARPSPLDASMPSRLGAFPSVVRPSPIQPGSTPTTLREPTPAPAPPPPATAGTRISVELALAALNLDPHADDAALDRQLDDDLDDQLDDQLDDEDDHDDTHTDDPLLAAALTGDPAAINRLYLDRTGRPPDPTLAAALARALQPTHDPSG